MIDIYVVNHVPKLCLSKSGNTASSYLPHPKMFRRYTQCTSKCGFLGQRFGSKMILEKLRISLIFKVFSRIIFGAKTKLQNTHFEVHWVYQPLVQVSWVFVVLFFTYLPSSTQVFKVRQILRRCSLKISLLFVIFLCGCNHNNTYLPLVPPPPLPEEFLTRETQETQKQKMLHTYVDTLSNATTL